MATKQHKWHKEIKAWADGAEIEFRVDTETLGCDWTAIKQDHDWTPAEGVEYRIKPQPKEPQYLYAWMEKDTRQCVFEYDPPGSVLEDKEHKYIGKIFIAVE
jgi:hypothetical protein